MGTTAISVREDQTQLAWNCILQSPTARRYVIENVLASWVAYARWIAGADRAPTRILLSLEGITANKPAGAYDIFIGLEDPQASAKEQFVARLAPFGVAAASAATGPHRGAGLSETFDISSAVSQLRASGANATADYKVSIVPVKGANDAVVIVARIAIYEG